MNNFSLFYRGLPYQDVHIQPVFIYYHTILGSRKICAIRNISITLSYIKKQHKYTFEFVTYGSGKNKPVEC